MLAEEEGIGTTLSPMQDKTAWSRSKRKRQVAFSAQGRFPVPAYSEFMPPPFVGFEALHGLRCWRRRGHTSVVTSTGVAVVRVEQGARAAAWPGKSRTTSCSTRKLAAGSTHEYSRTLCSTANLAWPEALAAAAARAATRAVPSSSCRRWRCRAPRTTRATCADRVRPVHQPAAADLLARLR